MDRKKALNELLESAEYYHDQDHPDVPFHVVRPEMKEYIETHPLFEDYIAQESFNEGRKGFVHPHSGKVLGGAMTLGALIGAALALKGHKSSGSKLSGKVMHGLGGAVTGAASGMIPGGIGKRIMDERFRDREVGPFMTDAAWDIDEDLQTASDPFVNAKVSYESQMEARNERMKQENLRHAVNTAAALGHTYIASQKEKKASYLYGIEKLAEEKKSQLSAVATGTGAALGSLGHDVYKGAKGTATAEGGKGIGAGLKSMAEGAGGKGKLVGNLLRQHGPSALIGGAAVGGTIAAAHALSKRKKEATVLDVMLEKLAGSKMEAVKSGAKKVMDRLSFKKARVLQKNVSDYKKHKPGTNWKEYAKHLGKGRNKEVAKSVGAHAGIAAVGGAGIAASRRKKEATVLDVMLEKLAGSKMEAVKSGAKAAMNRLSFKKARELQKEVKHSKVIGSKSNLGALKKNRNKEIGKSIGAGAIAGSSIAGTAYGIHKKKSKMTKSASAAMQTVKAGIKSAKSGAKSALDRLSFKKAIELNKKVKKMDKWKKLVPKKLFDRVKGERNKEALKSLGAVGLGVKGVGTAGVGAYAYSKHKKNKMTKEAAEKRSIGRDLASGARNAALVAAPIAAAVALKNKKALGVGSKLRSKVGQLIEKKMPKKVIEKAPGKLVTHLQKSEFGKKLLAGLDKAKSKIKGSKAGVKVSEKLKSTKTSVKGGAALHGAIGAIKGSLKGTAKAIGDQFPRASKKVTMDKKKFGKIVGGAAVAGGVLKATKASKKEKAASVYKHEIEKLAFSGFNSRQKARKAFRNEWNAPVPCRY